MQDPPIRPGRKQNRHTMTPRLIFGLAVIALGIIFTLQNLGLVDANLVLRFWPIALILVGLVKIFLVGRGALLAGFSWLVIGVLFLLRNLDVIGFDPWDLWPLGLVALGANILRKSLFPPAFECETDADTLSGFSIFTGQHQKTASQTFRGGDFTAVMGGIGVDLTKADIQGEAILEVFAFWGGIDIRVPRGWMIEPRVNAIAGGFEDTTKSEGADPQKKLVIRGTALMGGVKVVHGKLKGWDQVPGFDES